MHTQDILLAFAPSKALALGAIAVGSFNCVAIPAVMALQTNKCDPASMGAVAGALQVRLPNLARPAASCTCKELLEGQYGWLRLGGRVFIGDPTRSFPTKL